MKIFFIRHGQTTGDIEDRYGGSYDDDLTDLGRDQLRATANSLKGEKIDKLFTSPLKRAVQSAEIINQVLQTKVEVIEGLRERDYGVLGGLTKAEALERYPDAVAAHKNPANTDPEGEPQADFISRIEDAFNKIVSENCETCIVLAHGGSLKVILKKLSQPIPDQIGDGEIIRLDI